MTVQELLRDLGNEMGLGCLQLNSERACRVLCDDCFDVTIEFSVANDVCYIHSFIGLAEDYDAKILYPTLLDANVLGRGTGGASFGCDAESGDIILSRSFDLEDLTFPRFKIAFQEFLNYVEYWTDRLEKGNLVLESNLMIKPGTHLDGKPRRKEGQVIK